MRGEVEAPSRILASLRLREQELWITRLEAAGIERGRVARERKAARDRSYALWPVRAAALRDFFDQLGELLEAGVNAYDAMTTLEERVGWRLRPVVGQLAPPLARGESLAEQMEQFPNVFARATVGMVRAGERSGRLPQMCRLLAEEYRRDHSTWLALLILRIHAWAVIVLVVLIPWFPWIISRGMDWYLNLALTVLLPILGGLVVLDLGLRTVLRQTWFAGVRQELLWFLPGAAGYLRPALYMRVLAVLEAMVQAGAPFGEALEVAGEAAGPGGLGRQLAEAARQVQAGKPLGEALNSCTRLPYTARSAMLTAERAGAQAQTLGRLAIAEKEAMSGAPRRVFTVGLLASLSVLGILTAVAVFLGYVNYVSSVMEFGESMMP